MINVSVIKDNEGIKEIEVRGHSGYEDAGKDIVCSSVSTAVILTVNLLEKFNINFSHESDENIPLISLKIEKVNSLEEKKLVRAILENLVDNLSMVRKQYKNYLKINEIRR